MSEYARNVVAQGAMEHKTAGLFEPAGRVFGCCVISRRATVAGHSERVHAPSTTAVIIGNFSFLLLLDSRLRGNDMV